MILMPSLRDKFLIFQNPAQMLLPSYPWHLSEEAIWHMVDNCVGGVEVIQSELTSYFYHWLVYVHGELWYPEH